MPRILDLKINREKAIEDKGPVIDLEVMKIGTLVRFRNGRVHRLSGIRSFGGGVFNVYVSDCIGPTNHRFYRSGHFANPPTGDWADPFGRSCKTLSSDDYHSWDIVEIIKEP